MTKVVTRRRPPTMSVVQLAAPEDAMRFRLGDRVVVEAGPPSLLVRAWRWFRRAILRRRPVRRDGLLEVVKVDHDTGVLTLEERP